MFPFFYFLFSVVSCDSALTTITDTCEPNTKLSIGIGIVTPIGGLTNISFTGKEIKISHQYCECVKLEYRLVNFNRDERNINIFQISVGEEIKVFRNIYCSAGVGAYHIIETAKIGEERSSGIWTHLGLITIYRIGKEHFLVPEIAYYTVPKAIVLTLNFGIKL
ncbi:MAG: hypothetical protein HY769_07480 [Candidatus Stahlbacteria bacterium]|nr:hypothetical protein [Candidatus Stahlbacteria bacterium]